MMTGVSVVQVRAYRGQAFNRLTSLTIASRID
jgi:hypothetical protein